MLEPVGCSNIALPPNWTCCRNSSQQKRINKRLWLLRRRNSNRSIRVEFKWIHPLSSVQGGHKTNNSGGWRFNSSFGSERSVPVNKSMDLAEKPWVWATDAKRGGENTSTTNGRSSQWLCTAVQAFTCAWTWRIWWSLNFQGPGSAERCKFFGTWKWKWVMTWFTADGITRFGKERWCLMSAKSSKRVFLVLPSFTTRLVTYGHNDFAWDTSVGAEWMDQSSRLNTMDSVDGNGCPETASVSSSLGSSWTSVGWVASASLLGCIGTSNGAECGGSDFRRFNTYWPASFVLKGTITRSLKTINRSLWKSTWAWSARSAGREIKRGALLRTIEALMIPLRPAMYTGMLMARWETSWWPFPYRKWFSSECSSGKGTFCWDHNFWNSDNVCSPIMVFPQPESRTPKPGDDTKQVSCTWTFSTWTLVLASTRSRTRSRNEGTWLTIATKYSVGSSSDTVWTRAAPVEGGFDEDEPEAAPFGWADDEDFIEHSLAQWPSLPHLWHFDFFLISSTSTLNCRFSSFTCWNFLAFCNLLISDRFSLRSQQVRRRRQILEILQSVQLHHRDRTRPIVPHPENRHQALKSETPRLHHRPNERQKFACCGKAPSRESTIEVLFQSVLDVAFHQL